MRAIASHVYTELVINHYLYAIYFMEVAAQVVTSNRECVVVEVHRPMACANCSSAHGCQSDSLLGLGKAARLRLPATDRFAVGDAVTLISSDGAVLSAALWAYGMPLLCMLGGAMLGGVEPFSSEGNDLVGPATGAVFGLIAGFGLLRRIRPASAQWRLVAKSDSHQNICFQSAK